MDQNEERNYTRNASTPPRGRARAIGRNDLELAKDILSQSQRNHDDVTEPEGRKATTLKSPKDVSNQSKNSGSKKPASDPNPDVQIRFSAFSEKIDISSGSKKPPVTGQRRGREGIIIEGPTSDRTGSFEVEQRPDETDYDTGTEREELPLSLPDGSNSSTTQLTYIANQTAQLANTDCRRPRATTLNDLKLIPKEIPDNVARTGQHKYMEDINEIKSERNSFLEDHISWIRENITYRTCSHFIPQKTDSNLCQCGRIRTSHNCSSPFWYHSAEEGLRWDTMQHTKEVPTDTFGQMRFTNTRFGEERSAKFIRVSPQTSVDNLYHLFTECWQLSEPNFIISVTGGAQDFKLDPELSRLFKEGLRNVAKNTGAWIITGGTDNGVMSLVGDAIAEQPITSQNGLVLIGFVSWGTLHGRENLGFRKADIPRYNSERRHPRRPQRPSWVTRERRGDVVDNQKKILFNVHDIKEYSMTREPGSLDVWLNPNHTHFVLVDNGSIGESGVEIELRRQFEKNAFGDRTRPPNQNDTAGGGLRKSEQNYTSEPRVVSVLLEGGLSSLEETSKSLEVGTPIVIVKGSGRAADIISFANENSLPFTGNHNKADFPENVIVRLRNDFSKSFVLSTSPQEREIEIQKCLQHLEKICCQRNQNLVTIYSFRDARRNDLDKVILSALLKALQGQSEANTEDLMNQLQLAVKWNRYDTASKFILNKITLSQLPVDFLNNIFMSCCLDNKHEFIEYFLKNGMSVHNFKHVFQLEPLFSVAKTDSLLMYCFLNSVSSLNKFEFKHLAGIVKGISSLIGGGFKLSILTADFEHKYSHFSTKRKGEEEKKRLTEEELLAMSPPEVDDPACFFFFWAVIMNYHEMAKHFWALGNNQLSKALIGMALYKSIAKNLDVGYKEEEIVANAADFGEIALTFLNQCHKSDDIQLRQMLIAQSSLCKTHSVLGLADLANHDEFIAHVAYQLILDEIWSGVILQEEWLTLKVCICICLPFLIPWWLQFDSAGNVFDDSTKENEGNEEDMDMEVEAEYSGEDDPSGNRHNTDGDVPDLGVPKMLEAFDPSLRGQLRSNGNYFDNSTAAKLPLFKRIWYFYSAPITKFYLNMYSLGLLLGLYTYLVLGILPPNLFWLEIVLAALILSITSEEIRQFLVQDGGMSTKLNGHFLSRGSVWNWMDFLGIACFWIPFIIRLTFWHRSPDVARVFYIIDLFFWFMRILNIFTVSKRMGPVITMIMNMIPRLVNFSFVWIVFMAAFGTIIKAVSQPKRLGDVTVYDMVNVVSISYWQTYGELFLDSLDEHANVEPKISCTRDYNDDSGLRPCPYWPRLSIYFLVLYMLVGNILLMNLLIALFSSVYEEVNSRSLTDWKNKRMTLIIEYHGRPLLPPPFTIIQHIYRLFSFSKNVTKQRLRAGLAVKQSEERLRQLRMFEEENKRKYLAVRSNLETRDWSQKVEGLERKLEDFSVEVKEVKQNLEKLVTDQKESFQFISEAINNWNDLLKAAKN